MSERKFWTVGQVAIHYDVHPNTVYKAIKDGQFPHCRQLRRRGSIRIPDEDVQAWGLRRATDPLEAVWVL